MELYIEKEFLDNFYLDFSENNANSSQKTLACILREYPEIKWYINCKMDTFEEFEKLKFENPFFAYRATEFPPLSVNSIKSHFFNNSNICDQTLIFTENDEDWFNDAEKKGALCFSLNSYQEKIATILSKYHFKIDLSERFIGWEQLSSIIEIPATKIIINDSYILGDKDNQKMDKNLFPLIKNIVKNNTSVNLEIFTKEFNPPKPGTTEQIKTEAEKRHKRLNSVFSNYNIKFKIISNSESTLKSKYDFHDRLIYTNYIVIDSPKGFNLIPHKNSNSQLSVDSIFDKYTYNRHRNHQKMYREYFEKIKSLQTLNFKYLD